MDEQKSIVTQLAGKAVLLTKYISDGPGYVGPLVCHIGNGVAQVVCPRLQDASGNLRLQQASIDKNHPSISSVLEYEPAYAQRIYENLREESRDFCEGPEQVVEERIAIVRWSNGAMGAIMFWGEPCYFSAIHFEGDFKGEVFISTEDDTRDRFVTRAAVVEAIIPTEGQAKAGTAVMAHTIHG